MTNDSQLSTPKIPLLGLPPERLKEIAAELGLRPFAGNQIAEWIYRHRATEIPQMTSLPKTAREKLEARYCIGRHRPVASAASTDGTVKYLFAAPGGRTVEAVYIPDGERATLCVSSQVGCKMNCAFCMTGRGGFHGNLSTADILNQVLSIPEAETLTNIVFMGMGEPADNPDAVIGAIDALTKPWGLAWSPRRITVSTIGKSDGLRRLLDQTDAHIALSVHNPFPPERAAIMPVEKAYPLLEIVKTLKKEDFAHQRHLTVEYTMFKGRNDSRRYAEALARLFRGTGARVNLIRFHSIPGFEGQPSDRATMEAFRDTLNALGMTATIRASRGEDILAACGMLAGGVNKSSEYNHDGK